MDSPNFYCHFCHYPLDAQDSICPFCVGRFLKLQDETSAFDYPSFHSQIDLLIYQSKVHDDLYIELRVKEDLFRKFNEIHLIYRKFDRLNDLYTEISHTLQFELRHLRVVQLSLKDEKLDIQNSRKIGDWKLSCQSPIDPQQIVSLFTQFSSELSFNCYSAIENLVLEKYGALYLRRFAISSKVS